jgi:hypothetical protein
LGGEIISVGDLPSGFVLSTCWGAKMCGPFGPAEDGGVLEFFASEVSALFIISLPVFGSMIGMIFFSCLCGEAAGIKF